MRDEVIAQSAFFLSGFDILERQQTITVGTSAVQLLAEDSKRLFFTFVNYGTVPIVIWRDATVTTTLGIPIPANGVLSFSFLTDGNAVTRQWWGISSLAAQTLWLWSQKSTNEPRPGQLP